MADPVNVETEPSLGAEIERWMVALPRDLSQDAEASALVEAVRARVPVLTGTLAGSVTEVTDGEVQGGFGIGMGEDVIYAGWIEFGGSRGRDYVPQGRYVYPTLVQQESRAQSIFEQATAVSIERFGWANE